MIADVTVAKVVSYDKEDVWLFAAESFINQSNANEEKKDKKSSDAMSHAPRFQQKVWRFGLRKEGLHRTKEIS